MKHKERYITKKVKENSKKKTVYVRGEKNGRTQYFERVDEKDLHTITK